MCQLLLFSKSIHTYIQGEVTTIPAILTFATTGQGEVKGSSTVLWVGQAAQIFDHVVNFKTEFLLLITFQVAIIEFPGSTHNFLLLILFFPPKRPSSSAPNSHLRTGLLQLRIYSTRTAG